MSATLERESPVQNCSSGTGPEGNFAVAPHASFTNGSSSEQAANALLELEGACQCLASLEKTRAPRTAACHLKHYAENAHPTPFGYVSEENVIEAARRMGLAVKGDKVAVKLPRARRERRLA